MPGINILVNSTKNNSAKFNQVLENMLHLPSYSIQSVLANDTINIAITAYESYPRKVYQTDQFVIVLEGLIYNKEDNIIEKELHELASQLATDEIADTDLKEFITNSDGEFVIAIYDKLGHQLFVLNDSKGRLPLYYHVNDDTLLLSREIKGITPFLPSIDFNKTAIMEYLLFQCPLDENTFVEKIFKLRPGSLIKFNPNQKNFFKETICPVNFENVKITSPNKNEIEDLRELFLQGLKGRLEKIRDRKPIISLSGGLDARGTLAGLISLHVMPEAFTRDKRGSDEKNYAIAVAKEFGINIAPIKPEKQMDIDDYKRMVFLKDGLNHTDKAEDLDFLHQVINKFGDDIVMFTGMYGGENFRYYHLTGGLPSTKSLTRFLLTTNENYKYPTEKVCRMLNIEKKDVFKHVHQHLENYEENNVYNKYKRFRFEFDYSWAGEGEDRYRYFFWTITPYYSTPFSNYVHSIDENKKNLVFTRNFLHAIDPRTCNVDYWNNRVSLNNFPRMRLIDMGGRLIRYPLIRKITKYITLTKQKFSEKGSESHKKRVEDTKYLRKELLDLLNSSDTIQKYFSPQETKKVIENEGNPKYLHRILTIFLYMDMLDKGQFMN